jgi:hypothetical protein
MALAIAIGIWGARATWIVGMVDAWPRGFSGDFSAAMFDPASWDGNGIQYGPVFVIERWLTEAAPELFTIYFFAIANLAFVAVAFVASSRAVRASAVAIVVAAGAWLGFNRLSIGLGVAANPEFLELGLLCVAWLAASRQRANVQGAVHGVAAVTKLAPTVFLLSLLLWRRWRAVGVAAAVAGSLIALVGYGQGLSPLGAIAGALAPVGNEPGPASGLDSYLVPHLSREFLSVGSALARASGLSEGDSASAAYIPLIAVFIVVVAVIVATASATLLHRRRSEIGADAVHLTYVIFFALLPIVTLRAHPHTFLFLLPVWTGVASVLIRRWQLGDVPYVVVFGACYVLTGFPLLARVVDRVILPGTEAQWAAFEPMWGNLALLVALCAFAVRLAQRNEPRHVVDPVRDSF